MEVRANLDTRTAPHVVLADVPDAMPVSVINSLKIAARSSENELCGFVTNAYDLVYVKNSHKEPRSNFFMQMHDMKKAIERIYIGDDKIIAVFHTHPGGSPRPSGNDINGWPNEELGWRYLIATAEDVYEYQYKNQPPHRNQWNGVL